MRIITYILVEVKENIPEIITKYHFPTIIWSSCFIVKPVSIKVVICGKYKKYKTKSQKFNISHSNLTDVLFLLFSIVYNAKSRDT